MRFMVLLSGLAACAATALAALSAGRPLELVVRDAALASVVGALLGRWAWARVTNAFGELLAHKRAAETAAPADPAPTTPAATAGPRGPGPGRSAPGMPASDPNAGLSSPRLSPPSSSSRSL